MPEGVNFVKHRRKALTKRQHLDQQLFRWAAVVLTVVFIGFLGALGSRLALTFNVKTIKDKQDQFRREVIGQEENEKSFVIFIAKINSLADLFTKRRDKQEAIQFFTGNFDTDVLVSDISYDADDSILAFGLESRDVFTLEKVFQTVQSSTVKEKFQQIKLSDLKRGPDGRYRLAVTVVLKGGELPTETAKPSASPAAEEAAE
jgi:hypothetical protein